MSGTQQLNLSSQLPLMFPHIAIWGTWKPQFTALFNLSIKVFTGALCLPCSLLFQIPPPSPLRPTYSGEVNSKLLPNEDQTYMY